MRIVIMGTGPFAVPSFQSLLDSDHEVVALVTRPVEPGRRRRKSSVNPMRDVGASRGVTTTAPDNINDAESNRQLAAFEADLAGRQLSPVNRQDRYVFAELQPTAQICGRSDLFHPGPRS